MNRSFMKLFPVITPDRKKQLFLAAAAFFFMISALLSMSYLRQEEEALSSRIAPDVLRFHVLANSDTPEDQALKLEVKQMLIATIESDMTSRYSDSTAAACNVSPVPLSAGSGSVTRESMLQYIRTNQTRLEEKAETYMAARGYSYPAAIRIENTYFPTKIYGDVIFPCGYYDAVRVLLGEGSGRNWWCVLYPPLCFTDNAAATVPDSSKNALRNLLDDEDYSSLMAERRVVFGDSRTASSSHSGLSPETVTVQVRFRLLDLLRGN